MKLLVFLISLSFSVLTMPAAYGQANLSCKASDKGWEEHFGGHRTCGECLQKHGTCYETCSLNYYSCEVRGKDDLGNTVTVTGSGEDRYDAERNGQRLCQRNFRDCSVSSCQSSSEQVSRTECKK